MRRWAVDAGIVAVAGALTGYRIAVAAVEPGDRAPDLWAYGLGVAMAVALLARRRWPAGVLAVVAGLFLFYHVSRYPGGAPAVPVWIALYSVAVARRRRLGLVVAGLFLLLDLQGRILVAGAEPLDATLDSSTVVFGAALLLGETIRGRRLRLALLAAEQESAAQRRVVEERIRIARELHDVTAHTLAVVGVQAGVAADVLDDDPGQARAALDTVRQASREALAELRAAVGVLRDGTRASGPEPPAPGLDRLPALAAATGAVMLHDGEPRPLPRAVETTAYRIVQEAVANAVRHADARRIEVRLGYRPDGLCLTVRDDGRGAATPGNGQGHTVPPDNGQGSAEAAGSGRGDVGPPGNGLRGMTERATGLGGWLRAGPADDGGFQVRGWLPG